MNFEEQWRCVSSELVNPWDPSSINTPQPKRVHRQGYGRCERVVYSYGHRIDILETLWSIQELVPPN